MYRSVVAALILATGPAVADDLVFFRSPSGNIHCLLATGDYAGARCDIRSFTPSFTTPPQDCDLEWGDSFEVAPRSRKGTLGCHGDTVITPDALVLEYGRTLELGGIACVSETSGMTCTNPAGHGFTVAKARQRLF